ncbi:MAG: hypothetical protein LKI24_05940 [Acidipropionibacterium sp.]|jgi:carbonic anhydrase|nr:hypothetical protein [Acidipropionibacterium sp.]
MVSADGSRRAIVTVEDKAPAPPSTTAEALDALQRGNAAFGSLGADGAVLEVSVSPDSIGLPPVPGAVPPHTPFAAALGCADARVPLELVLGASANQIFTTRVAGNVPGPDALGSLHYAMGSLPTIQVVVVLGHSACGAITAGVDAFLSPGTYLQVVHDAPLRGIVDSILGSVRLSALALTEVYGEGVESSAKYREALIEVATVANAAMTATVLDGDLAKPVVFGVYDLVKRSVGVLDRSGWSVGLRSAPSDDAALRSLLLGVARSGALAN